MTATILNPVLPAYPVIGYMPMPEGFPYKKLLEMGRPKHEKCSDFVMRHPTMSCSRRAKIFAPFDALAGFSDRINKKETLYEAKKVLSEEKKASLRRKLTYLNHLFVKAKYRKVPIPEISITFFEPCNDPENDAYGSRGVYREITGSVTRVDPVIDKTITINGRILAIEDLIEIKGDFYINNKNIINLHLEQSC